MGLFDWFFHHRPKPPEVYIIKDSLVFIEEDNHFHKPHVHLILTTNQFLNNSKFQIMSLSLVSNQKVAGVLGLLDSVTNNAVSATFANVTATSDTPAAFTASVDSANNIDVVGVAAGTGNVNIQADATYTDSTGAAQTKTLTLAVSVTISAVVVADQVVLTVSWGTPVAQ